MLIVLIVEHSYIKPLQKQDNQIQYKINSEYIHPIAITKN